MARSCKCSGSGGREKLQKSMKLKIKQLYASFYFCQESVSHSHRLRLDILNRLVVFDIS